jgi:hypothetical protein
MSQLSRLVAHLASKRAKHRVKAIPHYRDPRVTWWKYPCEGGLAIVVEVGRPSFRRGEGHRPLRTFIEPDDLGSENEEKADRIKELSPDEFREGVLQGKFVRLC